MDNTDTLLIGVCYRSPNSTADNNEKLLDQLRRVEKVNATHVLIMGDFNFKEIDWTNQRVNAGDEHPASVFFDITQDAYLIQHVTFPTRHRGPEVIFTGLSTDQRGVYGWKLAWYCPYRQEWSCWNGNDVDTGHMFVILALQQVMRTNQRKTSRKQTTVKWKIISTRLTGIRSWMDSRVKKHGKYWSKYDIAVDDNVPLKKTNSKYKLQWMKSSVRKSIDQEETCAVPL